ncbi:hypothetical protein M0813_04487 [Anaeramoeba flamelloides]|uniref:Interferon-related developmental regulator N-terminal domain-containing protein n=1 Tax=Anaeramoeba flamelloides TaxID=1746091 RepID=A0ABQ8XKV9_9EUKA|nr:hypothetical protein M0813_04487 [Anaeramoeba flamelloides]
MITHYRERNIQNHQNNGQLNRQLKNFQETNEENEEEKEKGITILNSFIDLILSNDKYSRIEGYTSLNESISHYYLPTIEHYLESIIKAIKQSFKQTDENEISIAFKTLELISITLPQEAFNLYNIFSDLCIHFMNFSTFSAVRKSSIEFLTLSSLLLSKTENNDIAAQILKTNVNLLIRKDFPKNIEFSDYISALLESISICLTILPQEILLKTIKVKMENEAEKEIAIFDYLMDHLRNFLNYGSEIVRASSGETIALLYSIRDSIEEETCFNTEIDDDQVIKQLEELLNEASKNISRKTKCTQRSKFRRILKSVKECEYPETLLNLNYFKIELKNWKNVKQLDYLRNILAGGFLKHCLKNPIIAQLFNYEHLTEKKYVIRHNKKAKSQNYKKIKKNRQKIRAKERQFKIEKQEMNY